MPVDSRTMAIVRRRVSGYLIDTCRIERETQLRGSGGEIIHDYGVVASGVACRLIRLTKRSTSAVEDVGSQEAQVDRRRLVLQVGTAFLVDDRVIVTDHETEQDETWYVVDVEDDLTNRAFVGCMVSKVRNG